MLWAGQVSKNLLESKFASAFCLFDPGIIIYFSIGSMYDMDTGKPVDMAPVHEASPMAQAADARREISKA